MCDDPEVDEPEEAPAEERPHFVLEVQDAVSVISGGLG